MFSILENYSNKYVAYIEIPPNSWDGYYFVEGLPPEFPEKENSLLEIFYDQEKKEFYANYIELDGDNNDIHLQ